MSEIRVPPWLVSGEVLFLACRHLPSPCVLTWWRETKLAVVSFYKATNPIMRPHLMTSSNFHYLPKAPSPVTSTLGVRASTHDFGGYNSVHSNIYPRKSGKYR